VILSSQAGQLTVGIPADGLSYRVSKAAVSAVAAAALRDDGILVNAVHPGGSGWIWADPKRR